MNKAAFDSILTTMLESGKGVSDLLFVVGKHPLTERYGLLHEVKIDIFQGVLTNENVQTIAGHLIDGNERLLRDFTTRGSCDCSYSLPEMARFRVNIFRQNGRYAVVMRQLQSEIPTLEDLELPQIFNEIVREKNGIVFITGSTGSGKTTTLAALLDELNRTQDVHVVTLEDPIEFLHPHRRCAFSQRELGKDFPNFADGLRAALRQAPKVILVGEIRDRETMEIAMTASETGHLVFSTLHTVNAGQTINRILGMFSKEEEQQVRERLADTLRFVVSQRLVSKIDGGRLLVTEILGSGLRTRETLIYGEAENRTFQDIIEAGSTRGWHTFDQSLLKAYEADLIDADSAILFCTHKNKMRRDIDMVVKLRDAEFDEAPSGLHLESAPAPVSFSAV